jgi:hypothetical protein
MPDPGQTSRRLLPPCPVALSGQPAPSLRNAAEGWGRLGKAGEGWAGQKMFFEPYMTQPLMIQPSLL